MNGRTVSEQLMAQTQDMRQYQEMKVNAEKERDSTRRLYERFRREGHNRESAIAELKRRGYDTSLLN